MTVEGPRERLLRGEKVDIDELMDEVRPYVGLSPEETDLLIQRACRRYAEELRNHPDRARILNEEDPMPESSRRIWRKLIDQHRGAYLPPSPPTSS